MHTRQGPAKSQITQAVALLLAMTASAAALAQALPSAPPPPKEEKPEEVVITGTRVRGANAVGSPVATIRREAMEATGQATTVDIIKTLPNALSIGTDESNLRNSAQTGGLNVSFGTGINLRGLGSSSTLTLFNGRRVAPGGQRGQLFEPSSIPPAALSRIEVVADGASAVYGSDAVGGVVNLVLRKNFQGAETTVRFGRSAANTQTRQFSQSLGKAWDTGSLMLAYDHWERDALLASDRPKLFNDDQRAYPGGTDLRLNNAAAGNVVVGTTYYPILHSNGVNTLGPATNAAGANKQSNFLGFTALPKQDRNSLALGFTQELTERIDMFVDGFYNKRTFRQQNIGASYASTVPSSNPFFVRAPGVTGSSETVNYSFINDLGPVIQTGGTQNDALAAGANIDLGGNWKSEAFVSQSHSKDDRTSSGVNTCAISDPGPTAAGHRAVCGNTTGVLYDTNPATSLNVFGGGGNNNAGTLAKILGYNLFQSQYTLNGVAAKADGPVYTLPGGKVKVATGVEYYDHSQQNNTPNNTAGADLNTIVAPVIRHQHRTVESAFAEVLVPIVGANNAMTGVQRLELSIAGRVERYSDFGSTSNPKISFNWSPVQTVNVHGTYGTSFRAPTLADSNPDSTVGINIVSFREANGTTLTQGMNLVGGNGTLRPETAKTWSLGLDYKPEWLRGLFMSANYFNIVYTNRIGTPAADLNSSFAQESLYSAFVTRRPADATALLGSGFCAGKTFNACVAEQMARPFYNNSIVDPNQVQFIVDGRAQNAGLLDTSGVDVRVEYGFGSGLGDWKLGSSVTYIGSFKTASVPGGPQTERVNTVDNPLRLRVRGDVGWKLANYRADFFINYNNKYNNLTVLPAQSVASYTTVDATLGYSTGERPGMGIFSNVSVQLAVQNLFDRDPPLALVGNQLFDSLTGSALGRTVALQLTKKW